MHFRCRLATGRFDPCGCQFAEVPALLLHEATWKGRLIAVACGLLGAVIVRAFLA
jgi:hypothetical protein